MRIPMLSLLLLTTLIGVSVQQCTIEGFEAVAIEQLLVTVATEVIDPSNLFINETYYHCLATTETIGNYTFMSVSLFFTTTSDLDTLRDVRLVMTCLPVLGGFWLRLAVNDTGLRSNVTRTDCYECAETANNVDNCSPCDSSCTGLNQCYGPMADQCCSYNDGGNCVADCRGMNREADTNFNCVCSNFWTGEDCDNCSLNCENGGTPTSDCSACDGGPMQMFNDTIIGDPLYEAPLNNLSDELFSGVTSLCYEIHGRAGQTFNLISDGCVQVNANYSAMDIPENGNIISQIGVLAYDTAGGCIEIMVDVDDCIPVVNGIPYADSVYNMNGVTTRRRNNRTRITAPNCEGDSDNLVFWVVCQNIMGQKMIKFQVLRGASLQPDSHGLIGQFWNIPVTATGPVNVSSLNDFGVLYNVTVNPPEAAARTFIAILIHHTWDKTLRPCLYAGNSQGGAIIEVAGDDSVIEGEYSMYAVTDGIFGSNFTYNRLETHTCTV